jgi:site-specific DNA-adenine methylase
MGHYPKQDFYYGYLARYTGDSDNKDQLYNFFNEIREDYEGENRERRINFQEAGDMTRHVQDKGVVGVKINDKYGPGEEVVENIPDKRQSTDMSYLGGFHTGEFDLEAFKEEKKRAKKLFEDKNLEKKLKECEFIELRTAQPSIVTVSWFG